MSDRLDLALKAAAAEGLLPAGASLPESELRPWPVVLLTALGAWLAAIPLLSVVGLLWGSWLSSGHGLYPVGALLLAAAVVILRGRGLPPFVEQLAVPVLVVGLGSLAFALADDLPRAGAMALAGGLCLSLAAILPRPWLRGLLGAGSAGCAILAFALALGGERDLLALSGSGRSSIWLGLHLAMAVWLLGLWVQRQLSRGATAHAAAALEPIGAGWLSGTLAGLALTSGLTLLVGAGMDPALRDLGQGLSAWWSRSPFPFWPHALSVLLVLAAFARSAWLWPGLRRPWLLGVGMAFAGLAWLLPTLGAVLLALAVSATTWRPRLAAAAALAAAWILGSFYYQLAWPLAEKALALAAAGALLGLSAWLGAGRGRGAAARAPRPRAGLAPWLVGLTAFGTLLAVNLDIWQKESLIARGRPLYLELLPVDPRSLIQGDFMRLRFRMPPGLDSESRVSASRPQAVATVDGRGVATLVRLRAPGESLGAGELPIELTLKAGGWTVATDAWFFREGEEARWQAARYGEFRVTPDGRALLVGMADAELGPIAAGD